MKKTNLFLTIAALVNLLAFSGCGETGKSTSSVKTSQSIKNETAVTQDLAVVSYSGTRINNVTIAVYEGEELIDTVVTNFIGNASISIKPGNYNVKLSNLPIGYVAEESYEYIVTNKYARVEFKCSSEVIDEELPENHKYEKSDIMYNFEYTDTDGNSTSLKSLFDEEEKDLVILTFWASWCGFCINEFPFFNEVDASYSDRVKIIGLNADTKGVDKETSIRAFKEEYDITWTFALGNHSTLAYNSFYAKGIPLTVFISKYGVIEYIHNAMFPSEGELFTKVETYLDRLG